MIQNKVLVLDTENRNFQVGDIVQHFKHNYEDQNENNYRYKIIAFAEHTEEKYELVIYQALYGDCKTYARPKDMFMSEVDRIKYPDVKTKYRLTKLIEIEL